jgi:hypothetical protein
MPTHIFGSRFGLKETKDLVFEVVASFAPDGGMLCNREEKRDSFGARNTKLEQSCFLMVELNCFHLISPKHSLGAAF